MMKTEIRGTDATGFWSCVNSDNRIFYHKEPVKATEFLKRDIWKNTSKYKMDLVLGHCRYTSTGHGRINKNNHPHVSKDFRVALVHNGKITEYTHLKKHYPVTTECDSEILLRIFESGEDFQGKDDFLNSELKKANNSISHLYRVYGLKKIFSEVSYGAMAVALGEHLDDGRALWLFHNEHRPLCLIDLRETMGQFFFCSTPEIFRAAVDETEISSKLIPLNQSIMKLPSDWVFHFKMNNDGDINWEKIKINRTKKYGYWNSETNDKEIEIEKGERLVRSPVQVVTNMNQNEDVIEVAKPVETSIIKPTFRKIDEKKVAEDSDGISILCEKGIKMLRDLSTHAQNSISEGGMWETDADQIVNNLVDIVSEIEVTRNLVK